MTYIHCHKRFSLCPHSLNLQHHCFLSILESPKLDFPGGSVVKNLPANAGDMGSIPALGRSAGGGNNNPLQYSCLGNPMDRAAWWATVHGITKSRTRLSNFTFHFPLEKWVFKNSQKRSVKKFSVGQNVPSSFFMRSCMCAQSLSHVQLCVTPWTVAHQAALSMKFS